MKKSTEVKDEVINAVEVEDTYCPEQDANVITDAEIVGEEKADVSPYKGSADGNIHLKVYFENREDQVNKIPHHFVVVAGDTGSEFVLQTIDFQEGLVCDNGVNGVLDYMLLDIILARLAAIQETRPNQRNLDAMTLVKEASLILQAVSGPPATPGTAAEVPAEAAPV